MWGDKYGVLRVKPHWLPLVKVDTVGEEDECPYFTVVMTFEGVGKGEYRVMEVWSKS